MTVAHCEITHDPIDPLALEQLIRTDTVGAVVVFNGYVRNIDSGKTVLALEYEAHPDAGNHMRAVAKEVSRAHDVQAIALQHRFGKLQIGDVAVSVAVASMHRGEAFEACRELIDRVKHEVPIWKRQQYEDGTSDWLEC